MTRILDDPYWDKPAWQRFSALLVVLVIVFMLLFVLGFAIVEIADALDIERYALAVLYAGTLSASVVGIAELVDRRKKIMGTDKAIGTDEKDEEQIYQYIDDDGGPEFIVFDVEEFDDVGTYKNALKKGQSLWVRVGPIFDGDDIRDEPGVWIEYQENHMNSQLQGPVLIPAQLWVELVEKVQSRIDKFDKNNYGSQK